MSSEIEQNGTPEEMKKEEAAEKNISSTPQKTASRGSRASGDRSEKSGRGRSRRGRRGTKEREEKEFEEELLQVDRVTRVVKGGRRLRFRATVVIGDRKGRVGIGVDKALEVPQAIQKAVRDAKKNIVKVPLVDGTIPHDVQLKFKAAHIMIMPAKSGTGIIAGGAMRKIADLAGIEDMLGKNYGTSNRIASGKAMMLALAALRNPRKPSVPKTKEVGVSEHKTEKQAA